MFNKLWSREYSVQYCQAALASLGPKQKAHIPSILIKSFAITENNNQSFYVDSSEQAEFDHRIKKRLLSSKSAKSFITKFHKYGKEYVTTALKIGSSKLSNLSNNQLIQKYNRYLKILDTYSAYLWQGFYLNEFASGKGKNILALKNLDKEIYDQVVQTLFTPVKRIGILKLQDYLRKVKRNKKLNEKIIKKLLKEYAWMPCLDIQNNPWTKRDLLHLYKTLEQSNSKSLSMAKARSLARLTQEEISFFKLVKEFSYVKDARDEYRRKAVFAILPLFDEIGRRLGLPRKEAALLTNEEIVLALSGRFLNKKKLNLRKKAFVMFWAKQKLVISTKEKDLKAFYKKINSSLQENKISGLPASSGKVKGLARIVINVQDLHKIKKGDILVAVTTHPDFVPAMQKAIAIVTDEGGMTSHAAIVSREMKKPCIVGTKNATQVLNDGDLVEVDANKGIVRKISN